MRKGTSLRSTLLATLTRAGVFVVCLAAPAEATLIAEFLFNDSSGSATDTSGNSVGATVFGASQAADRFGNSDFTFVFDGVNDYIQTAQSSNLGTISFSVWFRADTLSVNRMIVDSDVFGNWGQGLILNYTFGPPNTNNLDVQFHNGATDVGDDGKVSLGTWHHAVVNFDSAGSNLIEAYFDGTLVLSQAYGPVALDGSDYRLGRHNAAGFFHGAIDDVRFYDHRLSAGEVSALFNEANPVPEPSTAVLLGAGIGALSLVSRRR